MIQMYDQKGKQILQAGNQRKGDVKVVCDLRKGERLLGFRATHAEQGKRETWVKDFQFLIGSLE
jgi:hypothetical protein